MNDNHPDILLSAYLDGEVTPAEHAAVEKRLAVSAEARQELQELTALRELLQSMPHETVSDDFTAAVLQNSERASLLPETETTEPPVRQSSRPRLALIASLVATAAALLLMTKMLTSPTSTEGDAREAANSPEENRTLAKVELGKRSFKTGGASPNALPPAADAPRAEQFAKSGFGASAKQGIVNNTIDQTRAPELMRQSRRFRARSGAGTPESKDQSVPKAGAAKSLVAGNSKSAEKDSSSVSGQPNREAIRRGLLKKLNNGRIEIGEVIPYFENRGNQTAVIEVTVVDVQRTVGKLQLLLARNSVPATAGESNNRSRGGADEKQKKNATGKDLIAVYVESSQPQLLNAMKDLTAEAGRLQFELKPPVALSEILLADSGRDQRRLNSQFAGKKRTLADAVGRNREQRTRRRMGALGGTRGIAGVRGGNQDAKPGNKDKSNLAKQDPKSNKGSGKSEQENKSSESPPATAPNVARRKGMRPENSFHFLLRVPESATVQKPGNRPAATLVQPAKRAEPRRFAGGKRTDRLPTDKKADRSSMPPTAPVRVIFIFKQSPAPPQR